MGQAYFDELGKAYRFSGVAQDMTANRKTQQITASEERFRTMIDQAPVAMALFSGPQFVITLANERVLEFWGRQRGQVMDKPLFEALPEAAGQGYEELLTGVYTSGEQVVARELPVLLERGGRIERTYIDFVYEPFREADGSISGVTVACSEVTDQVLAPKKSKPAKPDFACSSKRPRWLPACLLGVSSSLNWPTSQCSVYGVKVTRPWANRWLRPFLNYMASLLQILDEIFDTGVPYQSAAAPCDLEVNGVLSTYYFDFTCKPLYNEEGVVYAIMDMAVDVTEEVLARTRLLESEAYFRQLSDTIPAMVWTTQPDGGCNYLNKQWYDFTGQTQEQAEGYGWLDATHPDDKAQAGQHFIEANEKQVAFNTYYRLKRNDGSFRWVIDRGSPGSMLLAVTKA